MSEETKIVTYHWVGMRQIEVPVDCPTGSLQEMQLWLVENDKEENIIKEDKRDFEIVDIDYE